MGVQKERGPGPPHEFVDLAADVAQVDIGGARVGHVDGALAAQVHQQVRDREEPCWDWRPKSHVPMLERSVHPSPEKHHVRREDEVVPILVREVVEHLFTKAIPRGQQWVGVRVVEDDGAVVREELLGPCA